MGGTNPDGLRRGDATNEAGLERLAEDASDHLEDARREAVGDRLEDEGDVGALPRNPVE